MHNQNIFENIIQMLVEIFLDILVKLQINYCKKIDNITEKT